MLFTFMDPEIWEQTTRTSLTSIQTVFAAKLTSQIDNISCLCLEVWQKCNINNSCNFIVQPFDNCAYLDGREIWDAKCGISTRNMQSPNVVKMNDSWPK